MQQVFGTKTPRGLMVGGKCLDSQRIYGIDALGGKSHIGFQSMMVERNCKPTQKCPSVSGSQYTIFAGVRSSPELEASRGCSWGCHRRLVRMRAPWALTLTV